MSERGFAWWVYLAAAGAAVALLWAVVAWIDSRGYERGRLELRAEWDKANAEAAKKQREREARVARELLLADKRAVDAEQLADDNETKWKEDRRAAERNRIPLAACTDQPVAAPQPAGEAGGQGLRPVDNRGSGAGVRLTWQFVREYDAAWTGADGKPVYPASSGPAGTADAGAPSPFGPVDVLNIHGENAAGCSADRREFATLMNRLRAAEAAWDGR